MGRNRKKSGGVGAVNAASTDLNGQPVTKPILSDTQNSDVKLIRQTLDTARTRINEFYGNAGDELYGDEWQAWSSVFDSVEQLLSDSPRNQALWTRLGELMDESRSGVETTYIDEAGNTRRAVAPYNARLGSLLDSVARTARSYLLQTVGLDGLGLDDDGVPNIRQQTVQPFRVPAASVFKQEWKEFNQPYSLPGTNLQYPNIQISNRLPNKALVSIRPEFNPNTRGFESPISTGRFTFQVTLPKDRYGRQRTYTATVEDAGAWDGQKWNTDRLKGLAENLTQQWMSSGEITNGIL